MKIEFKKVVVPKEIPALMRMDRQIFRESDRFDKHDWLRYESYWVLLDDIKIGCCAFEANIDFLEDLSPDDDLSPDTSDDETNPLLDGSLYISTTGILPKHQGRGFGKKIKQWQIKHAQKRRFTRIVTNTRESNHAMIALNKMFGFHEVRITPHYYDEPDEATVVMELLLK